MNNEIWIELVKSENDLRKEWRYDTEERGRKNRRRHSPRKKNKRGRVGEYTQEWSWRGVVVVCAYASADRE